MFGDDVFDEIVELEIAEQVLGCGRCRGRCGCRGRDDFGNVLETLIEVEVAEEIIDDIFG